MRVEVGEDNDVFGAHAVPCFAPPFPHAGLQPLSASAARIFGDAGGVQGEAETSTAAAHLLWHVVGVAQGNVAITASYCNLTLTVHTDCVSSVHCLCHRGLTQ